MLFAGSTEGAHRACVLLGIIATCRALRVPAQAYLAWAFDRLGTHRPVFDLPLEALTRPPSRKPSASRKITTLTRAQHPGVADRSPRYVQSISPLATSLTV
jgi:hypothetical protein